MAGVNITPSMNGRLDASQRAEPAYLGIDVDVNTAPKGKLEW
jgi:hypothetical protein